MSDARSKDDSTDTQTRDVPSLLTYLLMYAKQSVFFFFSIYSCLQSFICISEQRGKYCIIGYLV
jgi:hypothetical protein